MDDLVQCSRIVTTVELPDWLGSVMVKVELPEGGRKEAIVSVRERGCDWVPVEDVEGRSRTWRLSTYESTEPAPVALSAPSAGLEGVDIPATA